MSRNDEHNTQSFDLAGPSDERPPRINWEDPNVPVGDSPPMSHWPLALASLVWAGWVAFLFVMMLSGRSA